DDYAHAIEAFLKAAAANPQSAEAQYNLGNAYYQSGKYPEAVKAYDEAVRLKPGYAEARTNLGSLLITLNEHVRAVSELQEAIRLKPDNPVSHNNLGYAYAKIAEGSDKTAALDYYNKAIDAYKEAI